MRQMYRLSLPRISSVILLSLLTFSLFACGYSFQGSGSVLPDDVKTVGIRRTENKTTEPGLSLRFTEKLRSRFERYGAVKIVDIDKDPDAILVTAIEKIDNRVRDVTGTNDIALELELIMTISAELVTRSGRVLYRNKALQALETFGSVSDVVVTSSSQFAQGNISGDTLSSLSSREVARGQQSQVIEDVMDEAARRLYLEAVAEDF